MSPRRSCSASSADAREALPNARETLRLPGVFLSVVTRRLRYGSSPVIAHILLAAAALAITLGWVGSNLLIVRPVKALVHSSTRLAMGDLSTRTGLRHGRAFVDYGFSR